MDAKGAWLTLLLMLSGAYLHHMAVANGLLNESLEVHVDGTIYK